MEKQDKTVLEKGKEKVGNLLFNEKEFISFAHYAAQKGLISDEVSQKALYSLQHSDAKEHLMLILKFVPLGYFLSSVSASVSGGAFLAKGFSSGVKTLLGFEALSSIAKNIFVRSQGKKIKNVKTLSYLAMAPIFSNLLLLGNLFKKHPELAEVFFLYTRTKMSFRKMNKYSEGTPEHEKNRYRVRKKFKSAKKGLILNTLKKVTSVLSPKSKKQKQKENSLKERVSKEVTETMNPNSGFLNLGTY